MAEPSVVAVGCPQCSWVSDFVVADDAPNGEWYAFSKAAVQYHKHFDWAHRPAPRRIKKVMKGVPNG